jgi:shikimate kinase
MRIILIGLPGSGKSTIASELCQLLNYKLIDTDEEISKKEKSSIEEIFSTKGENYFRETERDILRLVIKNENSVISTGGGTPCFFDNMETINKHGVSIFLNVPLEETAKRLLAHPNKNRPLILGKSPEQLMSFLKEKVKERGVYYKKANMEFKDTNLTADQIVKALKVKGYIH